MRGIRGSALRVLIIDHYDSYTNNILQLLQSDDESHSPAWEPVIVRYDEYKWDEFTASVLPQFDAVILSPGPGRPDREADFGFNSRLIREADLPILGICLGHQGIGTSLGAKIIHAPTIKHGQVSQIQHDGSGLFKGLPQNIDGVQYNSLVLDPDSIPRDLVPTAWTQNGEDATQRVLMGVRHRCKPIFGVQWHPESICSSHGHKIIANFHAIVEGFWSIGTERPRKRVERFSQSGNLLEFTREAGRAINPIQSSQYEPEAQLPISEAQLPISSSKKAYHVRAMDLDSCISPEDAFKCLTGASARNGVAWLDSAKNRDKHSRYSYLACGIFSLSYSTSSKTVALARDGEPSKLFPADVSFWRWFNSFQEEIRRNTDSQPPDEPEQRGRATLQVGFIGYFGYEMKRESLIGYTKPVSDPDSRLCSADAQFLFAENVFRFDHETKRWRLFGLVRRDAADPIASFLGISAPVVQNAEQLELYFERTKTVFSSSSPSAKATPETFPRFLSADSMNHYVGSIARARSAIKEGESYEMTLTTEFRSNLAGRDAFGLYRTLRRKNPAPYSAFMDFPATSISILSSSPERFISIDSHGAVEMKPIKGTVAVSKDPRQDALLKHRLATDVKELAENLMIVDLIRNDLHSISPASTIKVPKLMQVESYETVHQLVTTIQSQMSSGVGSVQAIQSVFPPGSMTGAPKLRSVQILDSLEDKPRGIYSGCLGYFCISGAADQSVVIRTIVRTGDDLKLGAGGAITWLSEPEKEWEEVLIKAQAVADVEISQSRADSLDPIIDP